VATHFSERKSDHPKRLLERQVCLHSKKQKKNIRFVYAYFPSLFHVLSWNDLQHASRYPASFPSTIFDGSHYWGKSSRRFVYQLSICSAPPICCIHTPDQSLFCSPWSGPLPDGHMPSLISLSMSDNRFNSSISDSWGSRMPLLKSLDISHNMLVGCAFPSNWWYQMTQLLNLDASSSHMVGSIPGAPSWHHLKYLVASGNNFTGNLPANVSADQYDLSTNSLSGGISFPAASAGRMKILALGENFGFQCPIQLGNHTSLVHIDLQNAGIKNCSFMNSTHVQLPNLTIYLDISHNAWEPMTLIVNLPHLAVLKARNASVNAFLTAAVVAPLATILLDENPFWADPAQWKWSWLTGLKQVISTLKVFSCNSCGLTLKLDTLASQFASGHLIQQISLSNNAFEGDIPSTWWNEWIQAQGPDMQQQSWPVSLLSVDLSFNPAITGERKVQTA
jgi:hypothetical protein